MFLLIFLIIFDLPRPPLQGRGVQVGVARSIFARQLTMPPDLDYRPPRAWSDSPRAMVMHALSGTLSEACVRAAPPSPPSPFTVLVVRRSPLGNNGGRAMLNHDEFLLGARTI